MLIQLPLHPKLSPFFTLDKMSPFTKIYNYHLLPNLTIVKNPNNHLFIEFKYDVFQEQYQIIQDKLLTLVAISKYEQFIPMKHFTVKAKESTKQEGKQKGKQGERFRVCVYFEYLKNQVEELDKYLRRKKSLQSFIVSEDVLLEYLYSLTKVLGVIEQCRYLRYGHFNLFSVMKEKQGEKLKVLFNPFEPMEYVEGLGNHPQIQYFEHYFLSPQELAWLRQGNQTQVQFPSQSDVFSIGMIILHLACLHLSTSPCYSPHPHSNARLDPTTLKQKINFVTQYYSLQFTRLLISMLEIDLSDRIGSSEVHQKVTNILQKKKERERMYSDALLRVCGEKVYKSVNYKLKFWKESKKGKVEDLKEGVEVESSGVFRGTFGKDQSNEGYYGFDHVEPMESEKEHVPKKIEKQGSTEKKQAGSKKYSKENKDSQSTQKKKEKQKGKEKDKEKHKEKEKSGTQKKEEIQQQYPDVSPNPTVDLQPKFNQYQEVQDSPYSPPQTTKYNKGKHESQTHLEPITESENEASSRSLITQPPSQQLFAEQKDQSASFINPQTQQKLLFEVSSKGFPKHILDFFGCDVPQRKYFKPQSADNISKTFKTQGIMIDKNIYYGKCLQGRRQGLGLNIFPQGEYYYGYYDQDMQHGKGIYWWQPTQYFIGQFHYGKKLRGWMINGTKTFFGNYLSNQKTGLGVNFQENLTFQGSWEAGKREGEGVIFYNNGDMFRGVWRNGKKNGFGLERRFGTKVQIQGEWRDDEQIHPVQVRYPNNHIFKGEFRDGKKTGKGQYYFHNGTKFQGVFQNDNCYQGSFYFTNNSIYCGRVNKALKRQGYGTNIDENGDRYEGEWVNDLKHGSGKYETTLETMTGIWDSGKLWEGSIVDSMGNYFRVEEGKMMKPGEGQEYQE